MATGNTNSRWQRIVLDEFDLSGDVRSIGDFGVVYPEDEITGRSDGVKNVSLGQPSVGLSAFNAVFNNTATTGVHSALNAIATDEDYLTSILIGIRAAPAAGDPCFSCPLKLSEYTVTGDGPVIVNGALKNPGSGQTLPTKVFGKVLAYNQALAATTNGTTVDNGAASTNGGWAYLHIPVSSGGTWAFTVEHSTNGSSWATHSTFAANGSVVGAEQLVLAGTINQYTRIVGTRTSGSCTITATIVRA